VADRQLARLGLVARLVVDVQGQALEVAGPVAAAIERLVIRRQREAEEGDAGQTHRDRPPEAPV
jgi:hypothetical protein